MGRILRGRGGVTLGVGPPPSLDRERTIGPTPRGDSKDKRKVRHWTSLSRNQRVSGRTTH